MAEAALSSTCSLTLPSAALRSGERIDTSATTENCSVLDGSRAGAASSHNVSVAKSVSVARALTMQKQDVVVFAASAAQAGEQGVVLSLEPSAETYARWASDRARHHPWGPRALRGYAEGTLDALDVCRSLTLICQREGCGALVHWMTAHRAAKAAGRVAFVIGDGCYGRACSRHFRPSRFKARQRAMATAVCADLAEGGRNCIEWPQGRNAREVCVLSTQAARAAVDAALAAAEA
jgi:hypothetical protein